MRLRKFVRSESGKFTRNGRTGVVSPPFDCATACMEALLCEKAKPDNSGLAATVAAAAPQKRRRLRPSAAFMATSSATDDRDRTERPCEFRRITAPSDYPR